MSMPAQTTRGPRIQLGGVSFGRLTAIYPTRVGKKSGWACRCECGAEKAVKTNQLTGGRVRSCGCLKRDAAQIAGASNVTHGMTNSDEFRVWTGMLGRCKPRGTATTKNYGDRGITVCDRWKVFVNFYADMGDRPPGHEIDRIDTDGPYEPRNCRWVTTMDNARNRRTNHWLTLGDRTMCITDWALALGITRAALQRRITVLNWPLDRALTTGKRR